MGCGCAASGEVTWSEDSSKLCWGRSPWWFGLCCMWIRPFLDLDVILLDRQALQVRRVGEVPVTYQPVESVTCIWMACVNSQATVFAPFVFRLLLNRYVASEGLGEVGSMPFWFFLVWLFDLRISVTFNEKHRDLCRLQTSIMCSAMSSPFLHCWTACREQRELVSLIRQKLSAWPLPESGTSR